jgi:CheY-like chemotaxis protein
MKPRIVLAEQSATVRHMVDFSLRVLNCEIAQVSRAQDVMALVRERATALILLRSDLGGASARTVQEQLRRDPSTRHIPLLILGDGHTSSAEWSVDGVADYVQKPFLSQNLVTSVSHALGLPIPHGDLYAPYLADIPLARPVINPTTPTPVSADPFLSDDPTTIMAENVEKSARSVVADTSSDVPRTEIPVGKSQLAGLKASDVDAVIRPDEDTIAPQNEEDAGVKPNTITTPVSPNPLHDSAPVDNDRAISRSEIETEKEREAVAFNSSQALIPVRSQIQTGESREVVALDESSEHNETVGTLREGSAVGTDSPEERLPAVGTDSPEERLPAVGTDSPEERLPAVGTDSPEERLPAVGTDSPEERLSADGTDSLQEILPNVLTTTTYDRVSVNKALADVTDPETLKALGASREVVERVAWAVVPALAEAILKEEVSRLVREHLSRD